MSSTVGDRIKQRRKELGLSAEEVAAQLGKSPATVYRYENGDIPCPRSTDLFRLATILKTDPPYLLGWCNQAEQDLTPRFTHDLTPEEKERQELLLRTMPVGLLMHFRPGIDPNEAPDTPGEWELVSQLWMRVN